MTPLTLILLYLILSTITLLAYGLDKFAARRGERRIREATLLLLALGGGWPGALLGQHLFRHKTRKPDFRLSLAASVLANLMLLAGWLAWV